jgi:hypothetical protein
MAGVFSRLASGPKVNSLVVLGRGPAGVPEGLFLEEVVERLRVAVRGFELARERPFDELLADAVFDRFEVLLVGCAMRSSLIVPLTRLPAAKRGKRGLASLKRQTPPGGARVGRRQPRRIFHLG